MQLANRYAEFRTATVAREHLLSPARDLSEMEIQARWFAGEFGRSFTTTRGEHLEIAQFGVWNREAGPDFAEAAISLNGAPAVRGSIELDPDARDWERHGHATNADYENTALHVFTRGGPADFFTRTAQNRNVPQLLLDLRKLEDAAPNPQPLAKPGRCMAPLRDLPREKVSAILEAAAQFRSRRKAARLARMRELHGDDEALHQALAATLGYKGNQLPFTLLAQRLPIALLLREKRDAGALLFGASGFLAASDLSQFDPATRDYLRDLWTKWWQRRTEFERLALPKNAWRLSGLRPVNHPQRRVAALAQIVRHWPKIRSLARRCDPVAIRKFFTALHDEYWDFHFTLTSPAAPKRMALIGESRAVEMLANVFFPLAMLDDPARWNDYRKLPAVLSNKRVGIAATRLFAGPAGDLLKTAAQQQGLLQIYEDFCMQDDSDCARCLFPRQLAKW